MWQLARILPRPIILGKRVFFRDGGVVWVQDKPSDIYCVDIGNPTGPQQLQKGYITNCKFRNCPVTISALEVELIPKMAKTVSFINLIDYPKFKPEDIEKLGLE